MKTKRTEVQRLQWAVVDAIDGKLSDIANQRNLLINCGLDREAERLNGEIVRLNARRKSLIKDIESDRRRLALYIPKILLLCDLLAQVNEEFADQIMSIAHQKTKNDFSVLVQKNIDDMRNNTRQWERAVLILDELNDKPLSNHFADISEEFTSRVGRVLDDYLNEISNNPQFKKFF